MCHRAEQIFFRGIFFPSPSFAPLCCIICSSFSRNIGIQFPSVAWQRSSDEAGEQREAPLESLSLASRSFLKIPLCHRRRHSRSFGFDFVFDCHARHSPPASVPPLHSATRGPVRNLLLKGLWCVLAGCCAVAAFDWVILRLCCASLTLSWIRPSSQSPPPHLPLSMCHVSARWTSCVSWRRHDRSAN